MAGLEKLEEIIKDNVENSESCVFLHPDEKRGYSDDELLALTNRDFETRLFVTGTQCAGDSVFLRTHHTDNARHSSNFNYVRDYLKAFHVTKNWTCAKSVLTSLLTLCFQLSPTKDPSRYHTFATSVASGLSRNGANTEFEGSSTINSTSGKRLSRTFTDRPPSNKVESQVRFEDDDIDLIRRKFCSLMDVIFKRMATKKFLLDDDRNNIYRLVHCETKYSKRKRPIITALFSFTLQIALTVYVVMEAFSPTPINLQYLALAITTSIHSLMIAIYNIYETREAHRIFGGIGLLQMMDFIINSIVPTVLTVTGFIVILKCESFIDAVLDSTALLFIPEIDDQLPLILGHRVEAIIKNFLIAESIATFNEIARYPDEQFTPAGLAKHNVKCGVQFTDIYITNMVEQGITADTPFQPYQVIFDDSDMGHQINPSSFVTVACLLKKIEWIYTTGYPRTTKPRVGYLRLTKINGEVVEIKRKKDPYNVVGLSDVKNTLEGLFIITTFQMSEDIINLRVCGSYRPIDFLSAFESYSLWDINSGARKKILSLPDPSKKGEFTSSYSNCKMI